MQWVTCLMHSVILLQKLHAWVKLMASKICSQMADVLDEAWDQHCPALQSRHRVHAP